MAMNPEAQVIFDKILTKLNGGEQLMDHDISFLRARRSYLTFWQRIKYGDILYLNKQFLLRRINGMGVFLGKSVYQIIINVVVTIISGLVLIYFGRILRLY